SKHCTKDFKGHQNPCSNLAIKKIQRRKSIYIKNAYAMAPSLKDSGLEKNRMRKSRKNPTLVHSLVTQLVIEAANAMQMQM
ncbi:hypothetical protein M5D96_003125, partial [Drosophila gunungcola]